MTKLVENWIFCKIARINFYHICDGSAKIKILRQLYSKE